MFDLRRTARGVSVSAEERPSGEGQKTYKGGTSSSRGSSRAFCPEYCCCVQGGSKGVISCKVGAGVGSLRSR
jgi:hypothetical protein